MKKRSIFPDISFADETGLLCISDGISAELLLEAYAQGIFPWPIKQELPVAWFSPPERFVLFTDEFKTPKKLDKELRKADYRFVANRNFKHVIESCRDARKDTWITSDIINSYVELHENGYAYCIECFLEGQCVGGLYGVNIGSFISGESMFHFKNNASKAALAALIQLLKKFGIKWCDCQVETPLLASFGARPVERQTFFHMLKSNLNTQDPNPLAELKSFEFVLER